MKDKAFSKPIDKKFEFDESVASVFDDMLARSVPFYEDVKNLTVDFILQNEADGKRVIDLGSSTAQFLLALHEKMQTKMHLKGIDNSEAMMQRAQKKCDAFGATIALELADILTFEYKALDFIVANYTLQFIRPLQRAELVKSLYKGLREDGVLLFSEKVTFKDKQLDKQVVEIYHNYKEAQGYSKYEIAQKREALENVLVPFSIEENIALCREAGFKEVTTLFQWANFVTFVAKK